MEILVLLVHRLAGGETRLGTRQNLAQDLEVLLGRAAAGELGGLDLVDLAQLHSLVDLHGVERQSGLGVERHRLDARLALGQVDAGLGAALDQPHRLEDRKPLANLPA